MGRRVAPRKSWWSRNNWEATFILIPVGAMALVASIMAFTNL